MWYVKVFLILVFIVVVVLFGLSNRGQTVMLRWWGFGAEGTQVDLVIALFAAYALGALSYFLISVVREVRLRWHMSRLAREGERLRRELDALRVASFEGPSRARQPGAALAPQAPSGRQPEGAVDE